jgi:hypothetical protein
MAIECGANLRKRGNHHVYFRVIAFIIVATMTGLARNSWPPTPKTADIVRRARFSGIMKRLIKCKAEILTHPYPTDIT